MSDASNTRSPQGATSGRAAGASAAGAKTSGSRKSGLGEQASNAMSGIKDQASGLKDSAKGVASDARDKVRDTLEEQKAAGADRVSGIAKAIRKAADDLEGEIPMAADYVRRAASEVDGFADSIRRRDFGELLGGVEGFARRQPTAFLGMAALAGFGVVRFLKTSGQAGSAMQDGAVTGAPGAARSSAMGDGSSMGGTTAGSRSTPSMPKRRDPPGSASSAPSGDPGGIDPEAPGFKAKPAGSQKIS